LFGDRGGALKRRARGVRLAQTRQRRPSRGQGFGE
jgi:hypothetical protein